MAKYACITLDMEPDHGDPLKRVHLLDDGAHFDRFVGIIQRYGAKVTMFTVTSLFARYGEKLRQLEACVPLEYAVHSHTHDPRTGSSRDELAAAQEAFTRFTGKRPAGYRAPIGRIDKDGLGRLMDFGYRLDSSIYNSVRPGEYGYFNLHVPNVPFWLTRSGQDCLLEFPFTAISTVRIVFALSYVKLLGWPLYSLLLKLFDLPDIALLLVHPYNFYTRRHASGLRGLEKLALTRNDEKSYQYFENMLAALQRRGYQYRFVSEMYNLLQNEENVPRLAWESWK